MRLIDDPEFWKGAATAPALPAPVFDWSTEIARFWEAVQDDLQRKRLLDDNIVWVDFNGTTRLIDVFESVSIWRKALRRTLEDDKREMARVVIGSGLLDWHVEQSFGRWATITQAERERQIARLWTAAVTYLAKGGHRAAPTTVLHGLPAADPDELLITSLASAPGAPPALPRLHQTSEGHLAAA